MCGIVGFNFEDTKTIRAMNRALFHRGPDGNDACVGNGVSLGHTRLAILDRTQGGAQPMHYKHLTITYNGEIYNYLELREELQKLGHVFETRTDTEVILAAYDEWGDGCVEKFNGMWAFCIHDTIANQLFFSRDRFGIKPLYYYLEKGILVFASEIKAVLEHTSLQINRRENINIDALELYFSLGYIPAPYSIYKTIHKLPAAHNLIFDLSTRQMQKMWQYYTLPKYQPIYAKKLLIKRGKALLQSATKLRMRSDVPVGAFLSGGLDSSSVVATMAQCTSDTVPHTFSVDFTGLYSERPYIRSAQQHIGTQHHEIFFDNDAFNKMAGQYTFAYDEPFGDYAGFPTLVLSSLAKEHVSVVLSGDGGDEIFGGYNKYVLGAQMAVLRSVPKRLRLILQSLLRPLGFWPKGAMLHTAIGLSFLSKEEFYANALETFGYSSPLHKQFVKKHMRKALQLSDGNLSEALRIYDILTGTLPDLFLAKVDRASMAYGLEVRAPFLDYRFMEYAQTIPSKWKQTIWGENKVLMRHIIRNLVPKKIVHRDKSGFTPPPAWMDDDVFKTKLVAGMNIIQSLCPSVYTWYQTHNKEADNSIGERVRRDRLMWLYLFTIWYQKWIP